MWLLVYEIRWVLEYNSLQYAMKMGGKHGQGRCGDSALTVIITALTHPSGTSWYSTSKSLTAVWRLGLQFTK